MGFLKKITRPISRVLDKVIPNEIKPALPFLAAAAPFMAPGIMGTGMLQRALVSGGLNLGAQLAQEGSEGDFNALSVALASGIGALSAPGTPGGRTLPDGSGGSYSQVMGGNKLASAGTPSAGDYLRGLSDSGGITDQALNFLGTGADKLAGLSEGLAADGIFSKAGAKALSIPLTQGTMDLASAEARRLEKQQIIDDALAALDDEADAASRASAIRLAMQQYGFTEDEITETISSAGYRAGGRVGFRDGSSTGSFGADRYASELIEAYNSMLNKGDVLLTDAEKIIAEGEYPSAEQFKNIDDRYEQLQKDVEKEENKFTNDELEDSMLDKDALKYYIKKEKELEDREAKLEEKDLELGSRLKETDISGILRTPEFQEWYGLWSKKDPKADDLPSAEYFERLMFDVKRPEYMKKKYDIEMKEGGLMNLGGREMDMRGGGFIPIGKKERADDVPARLSKNEFVMTADAVRAAGGGSVNEGAKRMYEVMNNLEARA